MQGLRYNPVHSVPLGRRTVLAIEFSLCGNMLVATTDDHRVAVWEVSSGRQFYPELQFSCPAISLLWITTTTFLVGLGDGCMATCVVLRDSKTLRMLQQHVTNTPIFYFSYQSQNPNPVLAVGGGDRVRLLIHEHPPNELRWSIDDQRIPDPRKPIDADSENFSIDVRAVEWLPWTDNLLLVMYRHHGIYIWDVQTHTSTQSIRFGLPMASGTLCPSAQKFVARTSRGDLQCFAFPLNSEQVWLPKEIREISFVHHIHGGTGFIVGRSGRAEIVDIEATLLTQTLPHESDANITSIACFDDGSETFLVATASSQHFIIWNAQAVSGNLF